MCGRYAVKISERYAHLYPARRGAGAYPFESFNVTPTDDVPVIRSGVDGERELVLLRWSIITLGGRRLMTPAINAKVENCAPGRMWWRVLERGGRCLILAQGFYEWQQRGAAKQPHYIHVADQDQFAFAGLWEGDGCTIVTLPANELMREIHNGGANPFRMPAILPAEAHETWLTGDAATAFELLKPYPAGLMVAWPVSSRVGSVKNDDAQLIEPIDAPPEQEQMTF